MKSATIVSPERKAAEGNAQKLNSAPRASVNSGRTHAPLSGRVHGTGVPTARDNSADSASAVLCNITEQTWILHRTHGTFVVAGRAAAPLVGQGTDTPAAESVARPRFVGAGKLNFSGSNFSGNHSSENHSSTTESPTQTAINENTAVNNGDSDDIENPRPYQAGRATNAARPLPPYALTTIAARTGSIDLGDKRTLEFPISARDIAEDLAREINADGGESSYFGVFVCDGAEPTADELDEAHERLEIFYRSLVNSADKQWERTHSVIFISDLERRAARELKFEKEWSYEPQQRVDCPACGEKLKPNVAVCRVCGAVLDRAKAAKWGLVSAAELGQVPIQPNK